MRRARGCRADHWVQQWVGLGSAVGLAEEGDTVYASMRTPSEQGALREACEMGGVEVEVVQLDVTDDNSDGWIQGRFALDDAGTAGLISSTVGF